MSYRIDEIEGIGPKYAKILIEAGIKKTGDLLAQCGSAKGRKAVAESTGLNEKQYSITLTRGLIERLDDAEIEAVLAHELTHIRNGDVRMMVIAMSSAMASKAFLIISS